MIKQRKTSGGMRKWLMLIWKANMNDHNFYILYKDSSENIIDFFQINDSDYFLEPLINHYLNGWVKFASINRDPTSI